MFVCHITSAGVIDWAMRVPGKPRGDGVAIASADAGGAYLVGDFASDGNFSSDGRPMVTFGSTTLIGAAEGHSYVVKLTLPGASRHPLGSGPWEEARLVPTGGGVRDGGRPASAQ